MSQTSSSRPSSVSSRRYAGKLETHPACSNYDGGKYKHAGSFTPERFECDPEQAELSGLGSRNGRLRRLTSPAVPRFDCHICWNPQSFRGDLVKFSSALDVSSRTTNRQKNGGRGKLRPKYNPAEVSFIGRESRMPSSNDFNTVMCWSAGNSTGRRKEKTATRRSAKMGTNRARYDLQERRNEPGLRPNR